METNKTLLLTILNRLGVNYPLEPEYCFDLINKKDKPWTCVEDMLPEGVTIDVLDYDVFKAHRELLEVWLERNGRTCCSCHQQFDPSSSYNMLSQNGRRDFCHKCTGFC